MGGGHHHGHGHEHGQGHHHGPVSHDRAFAVGIVLNTAFVLVEAFYGYIAGSMALCDAIMAAAYRGARSVAAPQRMVPTAWRMDLPPVPVNRRA